MKKDENKKVRVKEEQKPWELEKETEGLDKLQGERLTQEGKKSSESKSKE
jgi:hypothetical protein